MEAAVAVNPRGHIMTLSNAASQPIEDVAAARGGPPPHVETAGRAPRSVRFPAPEMCDDRLRQQAGPAARDGGPVDEGEQPGG